MNAAVSFASSATQPLQTPQTAPMPLDLDALRQVVGGASTSTDGSTDAPGGSW